MSLRGGVQIENELAQIFLDLDIGEWDDKDFVEAFYKKTQYQGFKAADIINKFKKSTKNVGVDWKDDVKKLIMLCHERGTDMNKMVQKMDSEGVKTVNSLRVTYGIQKSGKNQKSDVVTLPRVLISFPHMACSYAAKAKRHVVPYSVMEGLVPKYPFQMMCGAFPNMIPTTLSDAVQVQLVDAYCLWAVQFSIIISRRDPIRKDYSKMKHYEDTRMICAAAMDNSCVPDDHCVNFLRQWLILDSTGKDLTTTVKTAAGVFANWIHT